MQSFWNLATFRVACDSIEDVDLVTFPMREQTNINMFVLQTKE